ncbi:DUF4190 domain-containing protein [Adlercreutzia murintestinalis]|uniref:DUF4190 domain-containing protein n=1 Tax=Adlercreutzia murintestinalis TaxID=2941325 RepID=UPI00203F3383|nr:DUF4190 domain-containing protein [Adlercreutzia murintestinalis]
MTNEWNEQNQSAADAAYAPQPVPGTHTASEAQSASGAPSASSVRSASGAQPTSSAQSVPGAQPSPNAAQPVSGAAQSIPEVVPAPAPAAPAPAVQSSAASQQAAAAQPVPAAAQPSATPALICGILAIVLCFIPVVPIVLGAIAIVLAGKYFRAGGTQGTGKAARICGIIGIVASILSLIATLVMACATMAILDDYDATGSYRDNTAGLIGSASVSEEAQPAADAAAAKLSLIKEQDPQTMQQIADQMQTSFDEIARQAARTTGELFTLENIDVDPVALAQTIVQGFDYELSQCTIDPSDPTSAQAEFKITCRSLMDVQAEYAQLFNDFDMESFTAAEEFYQAMGEMLTTAAENTEPARHGTFDLTLTQKDGTWTVDEDSWQGELKSFFSFS